MATKKSEAAVPAAKKGGVAKHIGKYWQYYAMLFIPIVNIVFMILAFIELSKRFGQGTAFAIGLTFGIFKK